MANKIFSAISILNAVVLLAASRAPALAQTAEAAAGDSVVERRCHTVALTSENPQLPLRLIQPYLDRRADFQASSLVLIEEPESADATVTLTPSGERDTHIEVSSRITGQHASALSLWTDYPGMVASDVMEKLKVVCALPVALPSQRHSRGFRHFVGRVGFYTEEVLVDAAIVAGYAAMGIAMSGAGL
jgi:hypothetical protein